MEPLFKQLRELPGRITAMPAGMRLVLLGGLAAAVLAAGALGLGNLNGDNYQYAFTNLTAEDSTEAAAMLKASGIPYRLDAGGSALAVPGGKVYDVRLLLAAAGLPKGGGTGFELFDRGDLGVSEFTQKVNLRRAIEGELARTIGRLTEVRSARVHLTLPEKGFFKDEERKATAAVLLNLQPGRTLGEREIAGIRHLVASAVPDLSVGQVTVLDGRGAVLSDDGTGGDHHQQKLERELEQRIVDILKPMTGVAGVLARVNVTMNTAEVKTQAEVYDPEQTAVRSERKVVSSQSQDQLSGGGVAGAAANQPNTAPSTVSQATSKGASSSQDEVRNFEISRTTTTTMQKEPRLQRLSIAVVIDSPEGKPRSDAEVARMGEIVKRAVGFDEGRGDQLDISSTSFSHSAQTDATAAAAPAAAAPVSLLKKWGPLGAGAAALVLLAVILTRGKKKSAPEDSPVLRPGAKVAELEAAHARVLAGMVSPSTPALPDPSTILRDRARDLAKTDPARAAMLLRAWIASDSEQGAASGAASAQEVSRA